MTKINDGGPAFPYTSDGGSWDTGMTLRDWFAGQALVGLLTDPHVRGPNIFFICSVDAYRFADAMIAAREAPND